MLIILIFLGIFSSCTYSINMVHTEGISSDAIEEDQAATADVKVPVNASGI